jgi:hypothetical protein
MCSVLQFAAGVDHNSLPSSRETHRTYGRCCRRIGFSWRTYRSRRRDQHYSCVTNTRGISADRDTIMALGREAWNATGGSNNGSAGAFEALALSKKYQLSENMASSIVMCALQYGPIT